MWQLTSDKDGKRTYENNNTGSKCVQSLCYVDKEKNSWYGFDDLFTLPYARNFAAQKVVSLYALGLTKDDLTAHIGGLKTILKSTDPDKYEKAYANIIEFESKAESATNAIRQMSSLVCVYFTINDELIDAFDGNLQSKKLSLLEADPEMHAFFLNRQMVLTESYTARLNVLSQIVLNQEK